MINSPCKDCVNRTKPKTCDLTCEKWIKYKAEHEKEKERMFNERCLANRVNSAIKAKIRRKKTY